VPARAVSLDDSGDAGIDASGGKDLRSGLSTVLHEMPGKE